MKCSEFIRLARKDGWKLIRQLRGSHELYEKDGVRVVVPNHGSKKMPKGTERDLRKKMGV